MAEQIFVSPNGSASLVAGANITLSSGSGNITIIGGVNSGATTFLAGVSTDGNTAGSTGAVNNLIEFVGGTNITLSQSTNGQSATISIIGPVDGQSIGMSNLGNSDGTSGVASGSNFRYLIVGGSNITLSQSLNGSSGTLTIIGPTDVDPLPAELILPVASDNASGTLTQFYAMADHQHRGVFSAGVSTMGNTSGDIAVLPGQLVLQGGTNITLAMSTDATNGMTVAIHAPSEGTLEQWMPVDYGGNTSFRQIGQSTLKIFPGILEHFGSFSQADLYASIALTTNPLTSVSGTLSMHLGVYTRNADSLSLASSGSVSYTWQNTGNASASLLTGMRHISVPIGLSMLPGNYWIGLLSKTASAGANALAISNYGAVVAPAWVNDFPASQNATHQFMPGMGEYSAATANLPTAVAFSEIVGSNTRTIAPAIDFLNFNFI